MIWVDVAAAQELPELARSSWHAVADRARAIADSDPKKGQKLLAKAGFAELSMPVEARRGAELSLPSIQPLSRCVWSGHATCVVTAQAAPGTRPEDYVFQCKLAFGAAFSMAAVGVASPDGALSWTLSEVDACWEADAQAVQVVPASRDDLEGVGKGDEYTAPELVELSQTQVEGELRSHMSTYQYCTRKFSKDRSPVAGKMVVTYHIADDGSVDRADVTTATFADDRIQGCIVDVFKRLRFPKPMGGFTGGTFQLTFVGS
jgi:hypothetical protein